MLGYKKFLVPDTRAFSLHLYRIMFMCAARLQLAQSEARIGAMETQLARQKAGMIYFENVFF